LLEERTAEAGLILRCWDKNQASRPSVSAVAQELEKIKLAAGGGDGAADPYGDESELENQALAAMGAAVGEVEREVGLYFLSEAGGDASEAAKLYREAVGAEGGGRVRVMGSSHSSSHSSSIRTSSTSSSRHISSHRPTNSTSSCPPPLLFRLWRRREETQVGKTRKRKRRRTMRTISRMPKKRSALRSVFRL
jgi:hypothetical protein